MNVTSRRTVGEQHITLEGELDLATAPALAHAIAEALEHGPGAVIVDLSGLSFLDSSGLHVLLKARRDAGGRLVLIPGPPPVQRVFETTGTERDLPFAQVAGGVSR